MPVETFTRTQFETSLPLNRHTGQTIWTPLGLLQGEYCYLIPFPNGAALMVRSSIDRSGVSADCGKDSIRVWVVTATSPYRPLAGKDKTYTTRVKGWQERLTLLLRQEAKKALAVRKCARCGELMGVWKCKKSLNTGRVFTNCPTGCSGSFQWLTKSPGNPNNPDTPNTSTTTSTTSATDTDTRVSLRC